MALVPFAESKSESWSTKFIANTMKDPALSDARKKLMLDVLRRKGRVVYFREGRWIPLDRFSAEVPRSSVYSDFG